MRTKHEESSTASGTSTRISPDLPITTVSTSTAATSPQARRSEIRWYLLTIRPSSSITLLTGYFSLQDLWDLRQLRKYSDHIPFWKHNYDDELEEALGLVAQEIVVWARQHEAEGRYRDVEYLLRRVSSNEDSPVENVDPDQSEGVRPTLVSLYEKMGDYPAAEVAQERLLRRLFAADSEEFSVELCLEAYNYSRLLSLFQKRMLEFEIEHDWVWSSTYIMLCTVYRAAVLDIVPLNKMMFEQGLIAIESNPGEATSLHIAAKENAINLAHLLIQNGASVSSRDVEHRTPLHSAVEHAEPAMMELLLANDANVDARDVEHRTPLHVALFGKHAQAVTASLINAKADLNTIDRHERTPLCVAVKHDLSAMVRLLLESGADVEGSVDLMPTPLLTAAEHGREWAVKLLLEYGASLVRKDEKRRTALLVAVENAHESIVQILLEHGRTKQIAFHRQDSHVDGVLRFAVRAGNVAIVETLLKANPNLDIGGYKGNTALHQAVLEGQESHERIMQLLLNLNTVWMSTINLDEDTVLHLAVTYRRQNMITILLRRIAPNKLLYLCQMRNNFGRTPIDIARGLAEHTKDSSTEKIILDSLETSLALSRSFVKKIMDKS